MLQHLCGTIVHYNCSNNKGSKFECTKSQLGCTKIVLFGLAVETAGSRASLTSLGDEDVENRGCLLDRNQGMGFLRTEFEGHEVRERFTGTNVGWCWRTEQHHQLAKQTLPALPLLLGWITRPP